MSLALPETAEPPVMVSAGLEPGAGRVMTVPTFRFA